MSTEFIYTGTYQVRDGRFEDARKKLSEHAEFIEANEPRLVAFHVFTDEAAGTVSIVQVHRDPESMEFHMKLVAEHIKSALNDYLGEPVSTHVYGGAGAQLSTSSVSTTRTPTCDRAPGRLHPHDSRLMQH